MGCTCCFIFGAVTGCIIGAVSTFVLVVGNEGKFV